MSNKYYVNKAYYANCKRFEVSTEKDDHYSTEIEIKIIEPVYEYQVIYKNTINGFFEFSNGRYTSIDEFHRKGISNAIAIECKLYLPSKRERK